MAIWTEADLLKAMCRCARILHPYNLGEAEEIADRWALDETRQAALDELHRLQYLAGPK